MPYDDLSELPENVKNKLPKEAQEVYMGAYNYTWEEYKGQKEKLDDTARDETSNQVAWQAVEKQFKNLNGTWKRI